MKISTSLNVFETLYSSDSVIRRCKAAGFTVLDFNYWDHQKYVIKKSWEEEKKWAEQIRSNAEAQGVKFTQMHGPVYRGPISKTLNENEFFELIKRSLRTAAILGASWVVFHPLKPDNTTPKDNANHNCEYYSKLIPVMEETGVGIALENLRSCYSTADDLVELIDRINHPLAGVCWDTGHGHCTSQNQGDSLRKLGHRLKVLHIQDNDGEKDQHFLPFHGTIDWHDVVKGLRDIEFEGDFTYEIAQAIRVLPDQMRDSALTYAAELAVHILNQR